MIEIEFDDVVNVLRAHQWDRNRCECGWTQRGHMPRGLERLNHPTHLADQLQVFSQFGQVTE